MFLLIHRQSPFEGLNAKRWVGGRVCVTGTMVCFMSVSTWLVGKCTGQECPWPHLITAEFAVIRSRRGKKNPGVQWRLLMLSPNICPWCTAGDVKAPVNDRRIYRLAFRREVSISTAKRTSRSPQFERVKPLQRTEDESQLFLWELTSMVYWDSIPIQSLCFVLCRGFLKTPPLVWKGIRAIHLQNWAELVSASNTGRGQRLLSLSFLQHPESAFLIGLASAFHTSIHQ